MSEATTAKCVQYCTPHAKVSGTLLVFPRILCFQPDAVQPCLHNGNASEYNLKLDVRDILTCGAMSLPEQSASGIAHYLQIHVKTLDGHTSTALHCVERSWCVVFQIQCRDEQRTIANMLLTSVDRINQNTGEYQASETSVPFACLDCLAAYEMHESALQDPKKRGSCSQPREAKLEEIPGSAPAPVPVKLVAGDVGRPLLTTLLAESLLDYLPVNLRLPCV